MLAAVARLAPAALAADDYRDPGWYRHPEGTVAYEYRGPRAALGQPARALRDGAAPQPAEFRAVKPGRGGKGHSGH